MTDNQITTAIRLLKEKVSIEYISKVTGLTKREIEKLSYSKQFDDDDQTNVS